MIESEEHAIIESSQQNELQDSLEKLKQLLASEGRKYPDELLIRILVAKGYNAEKSKIILDKYINSRKTYPNFFIPASTHEGIFLKCMTFMKNLRLPTGERVFFTKGTDWDPDFYTLQAYCCAVISGVELVSLDPEIQSSGCVHIIDASNVGWKQVKSITPSIVSAMAQMIVFYSPFNLKKIICYNANWAAELIWRTIRPLLPSELTKLVVVMGKDKDKLMSHLGPDIVDRNLMEPTEEDKRQFAQFVLENEQKILEYWNQHMVQ